MSFYEAYVGIFYSIYVAYYVCNDYVVARPTREDESVPGTKLRSY